MYKYQRRVLKLTSLTPLDTALEAGMSPSMPLQSSPPQNEFDHRHFEEVLIITVVALIWYMVALVVLLTSLPLESCPEKHC